MDPEAVSNSMGSNSTVGLKRINNSSVYLNTTETIAPLIFNNSTTESNSPMDIEAVNNCLDTTSSTDAQSASKFIFYPLWHLFGETSLEDFENNYPATHDPFYGYRVFVLKFAAPTIRLFYMTISVVLLSTRQSPAF